MITSRLFRSRFGVVRTATVLAALALLGACSLLPPSEPRLVAIGDFHGDYGAFEEVMTRAGLMDEGGNWAGGRSQVIQVGDIADRGPDSRQIIEHLRRLQAQAVMTGGKIVALVGNHEGMVMTGDVRYVHPGEYEAFVTKNSKAQQQALFEEVEDEAVAWFRQQNADASDEEIKAWFFGEIAPLGRAEHRTAWRPTGEIGTWVVRNQSVVIVGNTLFVHGGLSAKYTAYSVEDINNATADALNRQTVDREASIHDPLGPQWYRGLLRDSCAKTESGIDGASLTLEEELDTVLRHFGVERIVIGHTPSIEGIQANHNGRVIQIDTGMSAHYGGTNSFLEVTSKGTFADNDGVVVSIEEPVAVDPAIACGAIAAP